jgi:hypothetical protein
MKTVIHENLEIENFADWYVQLHKTQSGILGAEWDKEKKILKIFYEDETTELSEDVLQNIKIPTVLKFRKTVTLPKLDAATVSISATENEVTIETHDPENARKEIKSKLSDFEEVI